MSELITLLNRIGFTNDIDDRIYVFEYNDIEYVVYIHKSDRYTITKDIEYIIERNNMNLKYQFVLKYLNKEFSSLIRKNKIDKIISS